MISRASTICFDLHRSLSPLLSPETRAKFDNDLKLQLALIKAVEIIGEAAAQMSEEMRIQNPQLPWRAVIGMRHVLVHEYFNIDLDILWNTVQDNLPVLIVELQKPAAIS